MNKEEIIDKIIEAKEQLKMAKKTYYLSHFYEFNRDIIAWPDIYEPLHRRVCNFIQDNVEKKKLLLLLPRGTFKSSIVTVGYTLWQIARNLNTRGLIANATFPMACQFLSQVKNHLTKNKNFIELFGDLSANADTWRDEKITVSAEKSYEQKEPTVSAFGMGSNLVGSHYSWAVLDDMVGRENIGTRDQIDKVINFYKDTLDLIDSSPTGHKPIIVIGTTWHQSDLYSWIQDDDTGIFYEFEMLRIPAFTGEWDKGELLFPTRLTWETLKSLRNNQGPSHFSSQYMLRPVSPEDAVFKFKFKYYDETDIRGLNMNKFLLVDPAISEKKEADFSVIVCIGVDANNTWYILDIWRDHVQPKRLLDQIFYMDDKWKPAATGIETVAFQKTLQFFAYEEMKRKNHFLRLIELKHNDLSKDERIRGLEPRYETGTILHNKSLVNNNNLEYELTDFPKGKNDDVIDALASGLEVCYPPKSLSERRSHVSYRHYPA